MKNNNRIIVKAEVFRYAVIDILFFVVASVIAGSKSATLPVIGYFFILLSGYMIIKVRKTRYLFYLVFIIGLINISVGINDFIHMGEGISVWQSERMRNTIYDLLSAKSVLLFLAAFNLFLNGHCIEKHEATNTLLKNRKSDPLIAYGGLFVLLLVLIYAVIFELWRRSRGTYISISNPIYEYSVIVFVISWMHSKNIKLCSKLLFVYGVVFSIVFLIMGDRSSVSMYVFALLIMYYKKETKINIGRLTVVLVFGLIFVNFIGIVRDNPQYDLIEILKTIIYRGFYVDTASWAYYSGITIVAAGMRSTNPLFLFYSFVLSLFGVHNGFSQMAQYAAGMGSLYFNRGGGFFGSYFYAWFRFPGVIISGFLVGLILQKVYDGTSNIASFYQILLIVFVIRWYIYSPIGFFRSVLLIGGLVYALVSFVHKMMSRKTVDEESINVKL